LGRSKFTCIPNSARYLNPRLRYYYFMFLKTNVRHVGILLPVSIFTFASPPAYHFASAYHISSKSDHLMRQSDDIISIYHDRPQHRNSTPSFGFRDLLVWEGRNLPALHTKFRRGEVSQSTANILLLPDSENKRPPCWNSTSGSNVTFASPSACHSASAYQISSKSDHLQQSCGVISVFFKMAAVSHTEFSQG